MTSPTTPAHYVNFGELLNQSRDYTKLLIVQIMKITSKSFKDIMIATESKISQFHGAIEEFNKLCDICEVNDQLPELMSSFINSSANSLLAPTQVYAFPHSEDDYFINCKDLIIYAKSWSPADASDFNNNAFVKTSFNYIATFQDNLPFYTKDEISELPLVQRHFKAKVELAVAKRINATFETLQP